MTSTAQAYEQLHQRFEQIGLIEEALAVLGWDAAAMMPTGGGEARGEQIAALSVLRHQLLTAPEVADWLDAAEADHSKADRSARDPLWQAANLREMRRLWLRASALPSDLVAASSRAESRCELVWREARPASDWQRVKPYLGEILNLTRQRAAIFAQAQGLSAYDALLDGFEPDGRTAAIDPLFDAYAAFLPDFLDRVLSRQAAGPAAQQPEGPFEPEVQRQLAVTVITSMGFDFQHGRLDISAHPFCGGTPDDVRITTRYDRENFTTALMGVIHETGHALYERGLPAAWRRQPVGAARGMQMHESQSLLMEMQACRSDAFLGHLAEKSRAAFGGSGAAWTVDNITRIYRKVSRGLIRVDADEVTYPAHVILRYRLEQALLADALSLDDLPQAWNDQLAALLGVRPPNDRLGVLQDIHWYSGSIGYFPTYSLGAMTAAQLFAAARRSLPQLDDDLARGDFAALLGWLRQSVHDRASSMSTQAIITAATGAPLSLEPFIAHLTARYLG